MPAEITAAKPAAREKHHIAFFRQSGWLMVANIVGGMLMFTVHMLAKKIPDAEYGVFGVLLAVAMCVPTMPLQMVFAQRKTAHALATGRERELAGFIRVAWLGTLVVFAALGLGVFFGGVTRYYGTLADHESRLPVDNADCGVAFWMWLPMTWGVMQGQQNFLWMGWSNLLNSIGRPVVAAFLVLALGGYAAGMMVGVCAGLVVGVGIGIWQTRSLWTLPAQPFAWRELSVAPGGSIDAGLCVCAILFHGRYALCEGLFLA